MTNADLSLTVIAYFVGTLTALLFLGRVSDHLGGRPVTLALLLLLVAGCIVLLQAQSVVPLLVGRFIMGIAAGLASSALMAYVADSAPERPVWLASVVVSKAPMLGLTLGALVSGAVVETSPNARIVVYVVMTARSWSFAWDSSWPSRRPGLVARGLARRSVRASTCPGAAGHRCQSWHASSPRPGRWADGSRPSGPRSPPSNSIRRMPLSWRWFSPPTWRRASSAHPSVAGWPRRPQSGSA